ncbi:hypothetical protein AWM68_17210, partial [Fictibacillus phosphorivorans]
MANEHLRDTSILVDVLTDVDPLREINKQMRQVTQNAKIMGNSYDALSDASKIMLKQMKYGWNTQRESIIKYRNDLIGAEYGYHLLAKGARTYQGSTKKLMASIVSLGATHKKATDGMMVDDDRKRMSIFRTIGAYANMTPMAKKVADGYKKHNPFLTVNNAGLKLVSTLQEIANRANPAAIALERLGANASTKDLNDEIQKINRGLGAMPTVAMGAAIAGGILYTALYKAAHGPNVQEVFQKQQEALKEYANAVKTRTREIMDTWGLFEKVQLEKLNPKNLIKNLQGQVDTLRDWSNNLKTLAARGVDEGLIAELRKMGPAAASEVSAMVKSSDVGLAEWVSLWREKSALAKTAAVTELDKLKAETDNKVQELQNSLKPLGIATEEMKGSLAKAFQPMVEVFSMIMTPIIKFITYISNLIVKFNEAHPVMAKVLQGIVMLVPILTLLLLPLGLGIGLINGYRAALFFLMKMIGPIITFMASMSATVWLVAAALVIIPTVLVLMYKKFEWFRNGVNAVFAVILSVVRTVISVVIGFIRQKMTELQVWWQTNGTMILQAATNVWNVIKTVIGGVLLAIWTVMKFVWPFVLALIISVWNNIKGVINGAIMVITGIIQFFAALFTGNWTALWAAVKQILVGAFMFIWNWINLILIGRFLAIFRVFGTAGSAIFRMAFNGIRALTVTIWTGIRTFFVGLFNWLKSAATNATSVTRSVFTAAWNIIKSITQGLGNFIKTIWNTIKAAVTAAAQGIWNAVKASFNGMMNAVKTIMNTIFTTIKSIWDKVMGFFRGVDLKQIGKDIMNGLLSGITSMGDVVWKKVKGIADNIKKTFAKVLDINSPSHEMFKLGRFTMQGAALGMEKEQDFIRKVTYESAQIPMEYTPETSATTYNTSSDRSIVFAP